MEHIEGKQGHGPPPPPPAGLFSACRLVFALLSGPDSTFTFFFPHTAVSFTPKAKRLKISRAHERAPANLDLKRRC